MRSTTPLLTFAALLAACQGQMTTPPASAVSSTQARPHRDYQVCGESGFKSLDKQGGIEKVPHIAGKKQFMGTFGFGAMDVPGRVEGLVFSCPTSDPIAPVPPGYTPDWFGSWTLSCKKDSVCTGLTFANANLTGMIASNAWLTNRTYYLYLYTLYTRQFIESYQIGPVTAGTHGNYDLNFTSPFENGLAYPPNEAYALEIVHASGT